METYFFYTNETEEVHKISGYSVSDAMNMLELAGFTVKEYIGVLVKVEVEPELPSYEAWAIETYGYIPA